MLPLGVATALFILAHLFPAAPGVRAAMDGHRHGVIDHWLQPVRDAAETHAEELRRLPDRETRLARLCELSIEAQVESLARTPIIQSAWNRGAEVALHGWVYALCDGRLKDLGCSRQRSRAEQRQTLAF